MHQLVFFKGPVMAKFFSINPPGRVVLAVVRLNLMQDLVKLTPKINPKKLSEDLITKLQQTHEQVYEQQEIAIAQSLIYQLVESVPDFYANIKAEAQLMLEGYRTDCPHLAQSVSYFENNPRALFCLSSMYIVSAVEGLSTEEIVSFIQLNGQVDPIIEHVEKTVQKLAAEQPEVNPPLPSGLGTP
jgi:hypothetical protein